MADEQKPREEEATYDIGYIKAARRDKKVALWDVHPQHPEGEIYIADGTPPVKAAFTPEVERAIADGRIVRSNESEVRASEAKAAEREEAAARAREESKDKLDTTSAVMPEETDADKRPPGRPRNAP